MANHEIRMTKEIRSPKSEFPAPTPSTGPFGIGGLPLFRHSSFVIRHWSAPLLFAATLARASEPNGPVTESAPRPLSIEFQFPSSNDHKTTAAPALNLRGRDARRQLLVTARFEDGSPGDLTRRVTYSVV